MAAVPKRISKMQKEVFALYRGFLRVARAKGGQEAYDDTRREFRHTVKVTTNIKHAEAVFGRGKAKLEMLRRADSIKSFYVDRKD